MSRPVFRGSKPKQDIDLTELRAAFKALRDPPWTEHEVKMARLYRAIEGVLDEEKA